MESCTITSKFVSQLTFTFTFTLTFTLKAKQRKTQLTAFNNQDESFRITESGKKISLSLFSLSLSLSLFLSHTLTHAHTQLQTHSLYFSVCLFLSLPQNKTHIYTTLCNFPSLFYLSFFTHKYCFTHTHIHTHTPTQFFSSCLLYAFSSFYKRLLNLSVIGWHFCGLFYK